MDHVAIIKELGGAKALADALTARDVIVAPVTVRSWTLAGRMIPSKYWAHIVAIAESREVRVSYAAFAEAAAARGQPVTAAEKAAA